MQLTLYVKALQISIEELALHMTGPVSYAVLINKQEFFSLKFHGISLMGNLKTLFEIRFVKIFLHFET